MALTTTSMPIYLRSILLDKKSLPSHWITCLFTPGGALHALGGGGTHLVEDTEDDLGLEDEGEPPGPNLVELLWEGFLLMDLNVQLIQFMMSRFVQIVWDATGPGAQAAIQTILCPEAGSAIPPDGSEERAMGGNVPQRTKAGGLSWQLSPQEYWANNRQQGNQPAIPLLGKLPNLPVNPELVPAVPGVPAPPVRLPAPPSVFKLKLETRFNGSANQVGYFIVTVTDFLQRWGDQFADNGQHIQYFVTHSDGLIME